MPLPLLPLAILGGSLISGGAAALSARASRRQSDQNVYLQMQQNKENWAQQQQLYNQQRSDALADWNAQNEYNHPLQQMIRLKQAGLNPNLIYGKGADTTAESIRATQSPTVTRQAPQHSFDTRSYSAISQALGGGLAQYYDIKTKQAQSDNLAQSTALMQQESLFKQANTAKTIADTARSKFDLGQAQELKDSVIEAQKLANDKTRADTQYTIDNNQRSELANSSNVKLTLEKIITEQIAHAKDNATIGLLKAQLQAVQQSTDINRYQQELTRMGIHQSDPWYFRGLMNLIHGNMADPSSSIGDFIRNTANKVTGHTPPTYSPPPSWLMKKK